MSQQQQDQLQDQSNTIRQEEQTETSKEQVEPTAKSKKKRRIKEHEFEGISEHKTLKKKILDILKGEK